MEYNEHDLNLKLLCENEDLNNEFYLTNLNSLIKAFENIESVNMDDVKRYTERLNDFLNSIPKWIKRQQELKIFNKEIKKPCPKCGTPTYLKKCDDCQTDEN